MANSRKGKKRKAWTSNEEDKLIKNVQKHVLCLKKAFEQTSLEIQRSPKAVAAHWYTHTSRDQKHVLFLTMSGKHVAFNRKNSKGQASTMPLFKKVLAFFGVTC
jgi:hypothetical protein